MIFEESRPQIVAGSGRIRLEELIAQFEDAWQRGERPVLDNVLPVTGTDRRTMLVELVHIDLEYRLKAGEAARIEDYLERYPELAEEQEAVSLIAAEYKLRCRY